MPNPRLPKFDESFAFRLLSLAFTSTLFFASYGRLEAQGLPLNQRVLVVYNSADVNSTAVANHYAAQRAIPATNLCAITPPSTSLLTWATYLSSVKTPVQNCLTLVGSSNILYIVFTYNTPYEFTGTDKAVYSIDQFIADIWDAYEPSGQFGLPATPHPYYAANQAEGNVYTPFVSLATFRTQNAALIYSVWRLDAATPALAQGLVDKAMAAEAGGLNGQVCIDETTNAPGYDVGLGGPEWDLRMAANFARELGFSVTEDSNNAEFGTAPAPLRCDNAALYSGWYSYNNYNNAFTWNTGAIGYHIDSASAIDPRGGSNWSANALLNGITATHGSVSEPYSVAFAHPDGVFNSLFQGANLGDAFLRNTYYLKWMMLNIGDPLYRPFPGGYPAITAPVNSLALNPQYPIGGAPSMGIITLAAAPTSATVFTLTSNQTAVATVPPTVTVPAGQTTASFPITTNFVASDTPLLITAASSGITLTNTLVTVAVLEDLIVTPSTVTAGTSTAGTIYLNKQAPAGGIVVNLATNNGAVSVPSTVTVPMGSYIVSFPISTSAVASTTSVSIGANYAGTLATATLIVTVAPAVPVISGVTAGSITPSGATITWTTDLASTSQAAYGTTSSYGSLSALNAALTTSHSIALTGLTASTNYYFQVQSQSSQGALATSGGYTFTTAAVPMGPTTLLQLQGSQTEVNGVTNGSAVIPSVAPAGFTGAVVVKGTGSVNYAPAQTGNGVYFLSCCGNTNNAYYKFTGATIGNIFNASQGQISFYLKSRYSYAQRVANASAARFAFDVRDGNGSHLFSFNTQTTYGYLEFSYVAGGVGSYYAVPAGTEDALFGSGVVLQVTISWGASGANLYLNNTLVKSVAYTAPAPNWSSASNFDLGAYEYLTYGGYSVSDDVINGFTITGPAAVSDTTPPTVTVTAPVNGAYVNGGVVTIAATATDDVGVNSVQFKVDGANLGAAVTGAGPSYSVSWNTASLSNGPHTVSAVASDAAGNAATSSVSVTMDTIPPTVSMTAPGNGVTVGGTVGVTVTATDSAGVTGVQFQLDGTNLGGVVNGAGPSYGYSWNSLGAANGSHTLAALATDAAGNTAASSVSITVNNAPVPPVISGITAGSVTQSGATITWTTDQASSSQVAYGTTSSYGSLSTLNSALTTSHSVTLTGLTASTAYHYQAQSQSPQGGLTTSSDMMFTTAAAPSGPTPLLLVSGDQTEVSGATNGSAVTPGVAPAGFTGAVVVKGTGSVNYAPAQTGNGVYFLSCCGNTNNAYYKFTGAAIGNIFNASQGQVSFYLKSRYSYAQRMANASAPRFAFDVRDGNGSHLFSFNTQTTYGYLEFSYVAGGVGSYYAVPAGTEDALFGSGVILQVTISWGVSGANLYLNNRLVKSVPYSAPTPNWSSASNFDLGAYEYLTFGGYSVLDDVIDEFSVSGPPPSGPPSLSVSMTSPGNNAAVSGATALAASASGPQTLSSVQFTLDGGPLATVPGTGPSYSYSWDTTTVVNGTHTLAAIVTDALGSTATSSSVTVTVGNTTGPVISGVASGAISSSSATITWSTNTASTSQVNYGLSSSYGSNSTPDSSLVTAHSVVLTGLSASTMYHYQVASQDGSANHSTSGDFTFTTSAAVSGPQPALLLHLDASEVSGVTKGSTITPSVGPSGFTGAVVANGTGSVNFTPVQADNGVYFLNCCANSNNAYYKFTGSGVGSIFNSNQGEITFYLKSRYSFAQRGANASGPRFAFDVRDGSGSHLFYFQTQIASGRLVFTYLANGSGTYYYVPVGTEDALFGNGVVLQVNITWTNAGVNLYLNNTLVKSAPYTTPAPNWSAASNFDLGAYEYLTFGGYNASDDIIDEFTVWQSTGH